MADRAVDLKAWLNTIDDEAIVAIDDGGLALIVVGTDEYYEIGGEPEDWTCKRSGSPLNGEGYCTDTTCPYSDHLQDDYDEDGGVE